MKISIVGLGKLGAALAAVLASKGHNVIGVDVNPSYVLAINEGRGPVRETGLDGLIRANRERLSATSDYTYAVQNSDLTILVVPTPSDLNGFFSMKK